MTTPIQHILFLNQGITKYGAAPHKPILLLAVIESFEKGEITDNQIEITGELFQHFYNFWKLIVRTENIPNFSLPFFHLKNEKSGFWKLITYPGKEIPTTKSKSIKSFNALSETVLAAQLSEEMFMAFSDPIKRAEIKAAILKEYFDIKEQFIFEQNKTYSSTVKEQILYDPEQNYARKVKQQIDEQPKESRDEFVVLRSSVFRKAILEIYNNQCSVTGLKVADANNRSLVDACHIKPFAETYNDSIRNGLALSPTFHRAFDRGLITISNKYKVLVHPKLKDFNPDSGIRKYENWEIIKDGTLLFNEFPQEIFNHLPLFSFRLKQHHLLHAYHKLRRRHLLKH